MDFVSFIIVALALVFIIEGLVYALFPDFVRKMMAFAITMPAPKLRMFGGLVAVTGFFTLWFMKLTGTF